VAREATEEQIAALRKRIQDAGMASRCLRLAVGGLISGPLASLLALLAATALSTEPGAPTARSEIFLDAAGALVFFSVAITALAMGVAMRAAAGYRRRRTAQVRRALAALPPAQRAEVLLPLRSEPLSDTRRIVEPLLRDLETPTEVSPAAPPPDGPEHSIVPADA
jgi:hypothetical protein